MTSQQICLHANDQELRQRVTAILVSESMGGTAVRPQDDPISDVIEKRWLWSAKWQNLETVEDANITVAVRDLWPVPAEPVPDE